MNQEKIQNCVHLFFDLDGTLTESGPGIINCVKYALEKFGIDETDMAKLRKFIGPPLVDSFMALYGFSEKDAREAMRLYRERFGTIGIFENSAYAGITEELQKLKSAGKKLYVATGKPEIYVPRILEKYGLAKFFEFAGGSDIEETRSQKWQIIDFVIRECHLEREAAEGKVVMIGDRKHDIDGAKKTGILSLGVLWGYGSRSELEEHGADHIIEKVPDLSKFFLG